MAPIKLKEIVTYSSQDDHHRAENLLKSQSQWNRWLCAPDDRSGCIQVELQLERAEQIGYIDVGNYCSSMVEIQVRRSYSSTNDFQCLLPATMFRTVEESRQGKCKSAVKMFNKDHFIEGVRDQKWDRVRIICRELSRKVPQFGLAFISFSSAKPAVSSPKVNDSPGTCQRKVPFHKGKSPKVRPAIPAWKKDTSFYRQYMETNTNSEFDRSELKDRILKISATSGDGSPNTESFGRSAKMLLAASKGGSNLREVTNYQQQTPTPVSSRQEDTLDQFRKKLKAFIREEGRSLAFASMKDLRQKFEAQLGEKMDKATREQFKTTVLKKAEAVMTSTGSPSTEGTKHLENLTPELTTPSSKKAGQTKRKIFSTQGNNPEVPKAKTPKNQTETPKEPKKQGRKRSKTPKKPLAGPSKVATPVMSNTPLQPKNQRKTVAAASNLATPEVSNTPQQPKHRRKTVKQSGPKPIKKKHPASAYRECPRCYGKFTANQMNLHLANCAPDHGRIARAALDSMAASLSPPSSPAHKQTDQSQGSTSCPGTHTSFTSIRQTSLKRSAGTSTPKGKNTRTPGGKSTDLSRGNQHSTSKKGASSKQGGGKTPSILDGGFLSDEPDLIPCPICYIYLEPDLIELHAGTCGLV